jgi:sugar (pentulose or hexulose) kinase
LTVAGPCFVGIDCGTQSAKVVVYDLAGAAVARGQQLLRPMARPRPGVVVHPDDDLWDAICAASRQAMASFGGEPSDIVGVGLCPIRCCKAFLRADGSLVEPVISWMDERAYQPYVPSDPATVYATTASGYLAHRLTGRFADTVANNILLQWPIDPDAWRWSDDPALYEEFGVRREMLFDLQMPGEVIGPITASAAVATGIPPGTPIVATANDKAVEMLGAGTLSESTGLLSLGTYICAMVHGRYHHREPVSFWTNFASVPHRYLYESNGVRRGMWTLTWFLDLLGPELESAAAARGLRREDVLEQEAAATPAASDGLMTVLDWLAPTNATYRKGTMLGFDARHTRGHLYRSIMEAVALTMHEHVDAMRTELASTLTDLVVTGGGAASGLFVQIVADVFDLPTSRLVGRAGGASLGAAICAAVATGSHPDFDTAVARMAAPRETFYPDHGRGELYRRLAAVYRDVRAATDPVYQRTHPIFH